ncbi:hypothetical protein PCE1_002745 [Barthelona sp. PCE]
MELLDTVDHQGLTEQELWNIYIDNSQKVTHRETALSEYYKGMEDERVSGFLEDIQPFFGSLSGPRISKLLRTLCSIPKRVENRTEFTESVLEWAREAKRRVLEQRIKVILSELYSIVGKFRESLALIEEAIYKTQKIDDKVLLTKLYLLESTIYMRVQNFGKAKGALIAAMATAHAIHVTSELQAKLDFHNGLLHLEDEDFKSAASYFFESFDGFNVIKQKDMAAESLIFVALSEILQLRTDLSKLLDVKVTVNYREYDEHFENLHQLADIVRNRQPHRLDSFMAGIEDMFSEHFVRCLNRLKSRLVEENLLQILEPYSCIYIEHIKKLTNLSTEQIVDFVESMILDEKLFGYIDQDNGKILLNEPNLDEELLKKVEKQQEKKNLEWFGISVKAEEKNIIQKFTEVFDHYNDALVSLDTLSRKQ